jgi:DNA-binding response OmpR family regulator
MEKFPVGKKIMIIDDDQSLLDLLEMRFMRRGLKVLTVSDAELALSSAVSFRPDLVLLDLNLNHRSGWDILEQFKDSDVLEYSKVIVLSGTSPDTENKNPAVKDIAAYITKPFRFDPLYERISELLL